MSNDQDSIPLDNSLLGFYSWLVLGVYFSLVELTLSVLCLIVPQRSLHPRLLLRFESRSDAFLLRRLFHAHFTKAAMRQWPLGGGAL